MRQRNDQNPLRWIFLSMNGFVLPTMAGLHLLHQICLCTQCLFGYNFLSLIMSKKSRATIQAECTD